ncbi:iron-containing alcohol dehydrogenase family protein [Lachnoclostridium sp. Marseille-P6806]|uniref:iron-containing alcohol dehydrogenase family protein n=1 Tax=Lachnoclostridium sp. Marseille-P6806 TaxID=2364793 RepID=UPI001030C1CE|nr:iron-containing alcohol dehydrogenase family protein [Lachnoclostridium sp. Marseille-P6806]
MQFYMPVQVYDEADCVRRHAEVFAGAGRRALVVTGRHSARANGSYDDVCAALKACGTEHVLFDAIEENPSVETVMRARDFGLAEGADCVIGIGGGSPLDAAKAIALMLAYPEEPADFLFHGELKNGRHRLPLVLIPTTCGTGSEVTAASVLTLHDQQTKAAIPHRIFCDTALVDGKYLAVAPETVIRNTAVDALGHLWESCLNADVSDAARMCADAGLKVWSRSRELLLRAAKSGDGKRLYTAEDYTNLMRASMFAGMAIAQSGTSLPHALSYPITYSEHMAHGAAIGYFQAGYLAEGPEELRRYLLETAGFADLVDWQRCYELLCGGGKLPESILEHAVDTAMENTAKLKKAPFAVSRETLRRIAYWGR